MLPDKLCFGKQLALKAMPLLLFHHYKIQELTGCSTSKLLHKWKYIIIKLFSPPCPLIYIKHDLTSITSHLFPKAHRQFCGYIKHGTEEWHSKKSHCKQTGCLSKNKLSICLQILIKLNSNFHICWQKSSTDKYKGHIHLLWMPNLAVTFQLQELYRGKQTTANSPMLLPKPKNHHK